MDEIWAGLVRAVQLIISLDAEVMEIALRSLYISAASCALSIMISLPLGSLIHFRQFRGKNFLISLIQTLFAMPTVTVGLLVFILFASAGPFGYLGFLFTPWAIIAGQAILITPVMLGLIIAALSGVDKALPETAISLGASRFQAASVAVREARFAIMAAFIMGFGRAISEVGLSIMVGGNIRGFTRTITTAMSLETSMGNIELSMALGIILMSIALVINLALYRLQKGGKRA